MIRKLTLSALLLLLTQIASAQVRIEDLPTLLPGKTEMQNGLWVETPLERQFNSSKTVVVADIKGPGTITMIHFALPMAMKLNRDVLIKMYWDGEKDPSVECPMVDFFCDPAGQKDDLCTALTNKRRGWNAYFPMPFRKSARVELVYDGPLSAGNPLAGQMPAYSYVLYRTLENVPENTGYFHAYWQQKAWSFANEYTVLDAKGPGKFIGWNITIRIPGNTAKPGYPGGYPVDENEKFFLDGEVEPSVEFQGMEDSFGFSWAFPETQSMFPLTGYFPYFKGGASCYRFFVSDAITFQKSLRFNIGFGKLEGNYVKEFSKPENRLQISTTAYWYQTEPHSPWPALPSAAEREPAPDDNAAWMKKFEEKK